LLADFVSSLVFGDDIFVIKRVYAVAWIYFKMDTVGHFFYADAVFRLEHTFNLNERVNCVCQNRSFVALTASLEAALVAVYDFAIYDLSV
jgi:hypothetical protein